MNRATLTFIVRLGIYATRLYLQYEKLNIMLIHIGAMRSGSTFLQEVFSNDSRINLRLKSRYFSYDPYYRSVDIKSLDERDGILVDSDENYSLGRFKEQLLDHKSESFNLKSEFKVISHDLPKMIGRLGETYPQAKILMILREQGDWLASVYRHDVEHYALSDSFETFVSSDLGKSYLQAGDYLSTYKLLQANFPPDNIMFLLFENLRYDPHAFLSDVYGFAGLDYAKIDLGKMKRNSAMKDPPLSFLRAANRMSETSLGQQERRIYFLLRNWIKRYSGVIDCLVPNASLVTKSQMEKIRSLFESSNSELAELYPGFDAAILRKHGYIK